MKVLIIEPDALLVDVYLRALSRAGYTVQNTADGQDAIEVCDRWSPDIIILELQLAGTNGLGFLAELRSYPEWANLPVVVHTFVLPQRVPEHIRKSLGIVGYLYKPKNTIEDLLKMAHDASQRVRVGA